MQKIDCKKGLTKEQVQERINKGLVNYNELPKTKTIKKIITDNIFNYFNFLNLALGLAVFGAGILNGNILNSLKNCLFMGVIITNSIISIIEEIISKSIQIPGVKVDRNKFLAEAFSSKVNLLENIINNGPVEAGITREEINNIANKLLIKRTSQSSIASFAAGIPGGLAMAATIPADILQFFGMSLRLAQELSYFMGPMIYGKMAKLMMKK